jgi:hypothetical protein
MEGGDLMSERALKALLGTVAGLVILWLAVSYFPRGDRGPGGPSEALAAFFDGVTPEGVTAIRFHDPASEGPVELKRSGVAWRVNGFRADSVTLARFWEAVDDAEVGDLVAVNPANHRRMGVDPDSAWRFEVESVEGSRSLLVGTAGSQYGTAFVRLPDEDQVHVLTGNLRSQITRSLNDWRNKRVSSVDTSGVWRIEVEGEEGGFVLQRSDSLWVMDGDTPTNATTVRGILGEMARLDASGFYEEGDSLSAPAGVVRALDQNGELRLDLEIGSGDGDRWVRVAGDSVTYRVASWRATRIFPDRDTVAEGG